MKSTKTKLLTAAFALSALPSFLHAQSVVGGTNVTPETYPWIVSLRGDGQDLCGGALIAPTWVLTAGHCGQGMVPFYPQPDHVYINLNDRDNPGTAELIAVEQVFVHSSYDVMSGGPDISLLKLAQPSSHTPVEIANQNDSIHYVANASCKVLGWGETGSGPSNVLKEVDIVVIEFSSCQSSYQSFGQPITDDVVCAGFISPSPQGGAGAGDSGGPLVVSNGSGGWKQIGVVSGGAEAVTTEEYPGVYTRVMKYAGWIDSVMQANVATGVNHPKDLSPYIRVKCNGSELVLQSSTSFSATCQLGVVDMFGKSVNEKEMQVSVGEHRIDISNLPAGVYVLNLQAADGFFYRTKFIKTD